MKKKLRVALIFGGTSEEREVSLRTGQTMAQNLDPKKYDVTPIEISRSGKWLTSSETIRKITDSIGAVNHTKTEIASLITHNDEKARPDVALLAMHGPRGEDGTLQGMLELLKIPYTCSGVLASALAMDKMRAKIFVSNLGIRTVPGIFIPRYDYLPRKTHYLNKIRGKVVVKPNHIGSSIGISIVHGRNKIDKALKKAFKLDHEVVVEKFIKGTELTVPVLGNSKPMALPVIEIVPLVSTFFDFKAKYAKGGSDEIVPARISKQVEKEIKSLALKVHSALGCRGLTRSDFILDKKGMLYFLEVNPIPGLTEASLTPKSAAVAGISYSNLLDILIKLALEKQ